ncbi:DUF4157 domain-containing protein [Roseofilum sp. BLCC_M154]|uniref:DUF4157 domain-containing protein n=1 Tax=Roseofilum acuticapitatum BLCC-M154 TaxID=3022444 RepID=A0ABT7AQA6_9CYAN|nr:DUF4157 domain-containing protein [Roseofilum acuticapitatum]MDJ1169083.1 DUF4157 domain-containing protein [Roseofilum acuticapitatum BLCC-M154]
MGFSTMRSYIRRKKTAQQSSAPQKSSSRFAPKVLPAVQRKESKEKTLPPFKPANNYNYTSLHEMYGHPAPVQAKLTIGEPGDVHEQQADAVASQVVQQIHEPKPAASEGVQTKEEEGSMGIPEQLGIQRTEDEGDDVDMKPLDSMVQREGDDEDVDMKPLDSMVQREGDDEDVDMKPKPGLQRDGLGGGSATPEFEGELKQAKGGGKPLDPTLQTKMGEAMGADFSGVKVHTDPKSHSLSQSIQAKAFTTGQDVFFNEGQYKPSSPQGQELIAHELTHVVQQKGASVQRKKNVKRFCEK